MAKFIELTVSSFTGKKQVSVNIEMLQSVTPLDQGSRIRFNDGREVDVDERYPELVRTLFEAGKI